ncbi:MAG: hypothetical protein JXL84_03575 [Deltaproteobacteria bacterium]|nr:hypothetical protein [Deltaproteobacteria bacterium]
MESEELIALMQEVESKGIDWNQVKESIKVPHALLKLYANSGPVPVTITKNLRKFLDSQGK